MNNQLVNERNYEIENKFQTDGNDALIYREKLEEIAAFPDKYKIVIEIWEQMLEYDRLVGAQTKIGHFLFLTDRCASEELPEILKDWKKMVFNIKKLKLT